MARASTSLSPQGAPASTSPIAVACSSVQPPRRRTRESPAAGSRDGGAEGFVDMLAAEHTGPAVHGHVILSR